MGLLRDSNGVIMKAIFVGTLSVGFEIKAVINDASLPVDIDKFLSNGHLVEAVEVKDPSSADDPYPSAESGVAFVVYGSFGNGIKVFGPFEDSDIAQDFAEANRPDDDEYEIFQAQDPIWRMSEASCEVNEDGAGIIAEFSLLHGGSNVFGYTAEARRTGDPNEYHEVRVSVFGGEQHRCIADILVGLNESGEVRALVTADGDGDSDHCIAIYPQRPKDRAIDVDFK